MAAPQPAAEVARPSFAKVAGTTSQDQSKVHNGSAQLASPANLQSLTTNPGLVIANGAGARGPSSQRPSSKQADKSLNTPSNMEKVSDSLTHLNLTAATPSLVVNGSGSPAALKSGVLRDNGSDESAKADSGSELGAKPPSIDGKSITSGTTFALDEKESLRPDDSASVKAAAEDDDGLSVRGSLLAGSRMGSDIAARGRGIALGDIPERRLMQQPPGGLLTPQSGSSDQKPGVDASTGSSDALNVIYRQAPDEKLLDAMQSPRDRLFLLRLEKDVIDFVQDSKEPYMDLPPSNSFCRMLIHKLADYYHMTHSYEHHIGSVRIFRTPFCRVPQSLSSMVSETEVSASSTPPLPVILPKKIMRRGQEGEAGTPSAGPSKPTSEVGSDKDKPTANQKLTREKREEMYKQARERIFGSAEDTTPDTETDQGMSRTSSMSQNRSNVGKRGKTGKQRRDDSDSFDSRNQYTPYWGPQQQTWVPQPFAQPQAGPVAQQLGPGYQPPPAQGYGQPPPAYPPAPPMMQTAQAFPQYAMPQPYAHAQSPARNNLLPGGSPMASYGSPVPVQAPQNWQQGYTSAPYAPRGPGSASPAQMGAAPMGQSPSQMGPASLAHQHNSNIPYAYGQLPANVNPHDPKSQHPIPGSYNRNPGFNPQTQSFIPGGNNMPGPHAPQPPFTAPGSHHGSPQIGTTHLAYPGYQAPHQQPYPGGYGMARQLSNTSMPGYFPPPQQQMAPLQGQHPGMVAPKPPQMHSPYPHTNGSQAQYPPSRPPPQHQGHSQAYGHLPAYGNPASLPQKPATGL